MTRPWPTPSLQGLRQHFHVALLELVALVGRHADAWRDRKVVKGQGRSERGVFIQCIYKYIHTRVTKNI